MVRYTPELCYGRIYTSSFMVEYTQVVCFGITDTGIVLS